MIPGVVNLTLYRGDWYGWRVRLWNDEAMSEPYDLTGHTVAAQFRDKAGGTTVVDLHCVITPPNVIDVEITAALWTGAPPAGSWDLQITDSGGRPMTPIGGTVTVRQDVTVVAGP